jgi:endonuclease/exonuclease/phosphatase family metal-dependent hydrolase
MDSENVPASAYGPKTFYSMHAMYRAGAVVATWWLGNPRTHVPREVQRISDGRLVARPAWVWRDGAWAEAPQQQGQAVLNADSLRVATFNVLHAAGYMDWLLHSPERIRYQLEVLLPALNADVICLNEVSTEYVRALKSSRWVQQNFQLSCVDEAYYTSHYRANVMLSRLPFVQLFHLDSNRGAHVGLFEPRAGVRFVVCAAHLRAEERWLRYRDLQLQHLQGLVQEQFGAQVPVLIVGDLNLHREEEDSSIRAPYVDVWAALRPGEPGFTWDWERNAMTQRFLPSDGRRMRLDRVLLNPGPKDSNGAAMRATRIAMFGDAPIGAGGCYSYLFPSDHFGLVTDLEVPGRPDAPGCSGARARSRSPQA